jgi:phage N-6-adenine-methyltransferase
LKGIVTIGVNNGGSDEWRTPPRLFRNLNDEFNFTVDAAASPDNALLPKHWSNAFSEQWEGERVFCNPPFSLVPAFLQNAHRPDLAVFLIPERTHTLWWLEHVLMNPHCHEIRHLLRTVRFIPPSGAKQKVLNNRAPMACAVVTYLNQKRTGEIRQTVICADTALTLHVINRGAKGGRPTVYDATTLDAVINLYERQRKPVKEVAETLQIPLSSVYRIVQRLY